MTQMGGDVFLSHLVILVFMIIVLMCRCHCRWSMTVMIVVVVAESHSQMLLHLFFSSAVLSHDGKAPS